MERAPGPACESFRAGSIGVGAAALWDRLGACVADVERIAAAQPT